MPHRTALRDDVLRAVLYYDIFRHPLRLDELARLCGGDVEPAVVQLEAEGHVERDGRYVCRHGRLSQVAARRARSAAAERAWSDAQRAASTLARFPWVRGVLVTGGLSKQSAVDDGDVDFLLLCAAGSVWTTKSTLHVLRRGLPERVRNLFCTNYLLDEQHLLVDDRNAYTAMELATAVPMYGPEACTALLTTNRWAERYVPGYAWSIERARHAPALPARSARPLERLVAPVRPRLEAVSMATWSRFWDQKYDWLPDEVRSQRFKRRPEIATNHLHDFQDYVLAEYGQRLAAVAVDAP